MDSSPPHATLVAAQPSRLRKVARRFDAVFMFTVLLPTLFAGLYFGLVASDVYISESRFVVKNPQRSAQTGLGALLQGTAFSRSQDDTYSVHDYILSRDALRELDEKLKFRDAFTREDIAVTDRFAGIGWDASFEALHRYYLKHVSIDYDTVSSITVLKVRAYTADESKKINDLLLQMGERLVNNLNTRSRQDLIQVAEQEVRVAEERAKNAAVALSSYRADRGVFDPDRQGSLQLQGVAKLQEELIATEAQLAQIRQVAPSNSQIPVLQQRVEGLRRAIGAESAKVVGRGTSLTSKSPAFDRLTLERTFADRQLATALGGLDSARNEAQRKQLYLERLVQPNLPDKAVEPRRMRTVFMVFLVGLLLWGVSSLVIASIREHTE